jgi:hypothetical protein
MTAENRREQLLALIQATNANTPEGIEPSQELRRRLGVLQARDEYAAWEAQLDDLTKQIIATGQELKHRTEELQKQPPPAGRPYPPFYTAWHVAIDEFRRLLQERDKHVEKRPATPPPVEPWEKLLASGRELK